MSLYRDEFLAPGDRLPMRLARGVKLPFFDWLPVEPGYGMPFWLEYQKKHGTSPWLSPSGVTLRVHRPTLGSAVAGAEPTGVVGGYSTLIFDRGVYRLYHETYGRDHRGDLGALLCVIESVDGRSWGRPELGLLEYRGSRANNIVFGCGARATGGGFGGHGASVFLDGEAPPGERYKLAFLGPPGEGANLAAWVWGAVSPDGYRWTLLEEPLLKTLSDTQNVLGRVGGRYRLFLRGWSPQGPAGGGGRRIVRVAETGEFGPFDPPSDLLRVPSRWGPARDLYTSSWHLWPGSDAQLMLPTVYDRDADTTEVHFAASRDGAHFDFPSESPLIGSSSDPLARTVYAGTGLHSTGAGEWSFPVHVSAKAHNEYANKPRSLHLATIREDGFASIGAKLTGSFSLLPALIEGENLALNATASPGGFIRARLVALDGEGGIHPLPGFDYSDMAPMSGDLLYRRVQWAGGSLAAHAGRPVRAQFELTRAEIFAVRAE